MNQISASDTNALAAQWVDPFYMEILNGNYLSLKEAESARFIAQVKQALAIIDEDTAARLLSVPDWRNQLAGSWLCALKGWNNFAAPIGAGFVASRVCFAGQGCAFALACFGDDVSCEYLTEYLNRYLYLPSCHYEQHWAMPALMWIDSQRKTAYAHPYLVRGGAWHRFAATKNSAWKLKPNKEKFWHLMNFCHQHFNRERPLNDDYIRT